MPASTRRRPKPQPATGETLEDALQRISWFAGENNINGVRDEAIALARKQKLTLQEVEKLRMIIEKIQLHMSALTAYEHHAVVITGVSRNGSVSAEVAGLGGGRVMVAVAPDVDASHLQVGAAALVSREKNCLLKVTSPTARWTDVGAFERQLDDRRILLRVRESLVAVELAESLRGSELKFGDEVGFDSEVSGLAFARLDSPKGEQLFDENVTDDFSQLGGLEDQIETIKRQIDFRFVHPELAEMYGVDTERGILLTGAPGNGKTRIARCCAGYLRELFPDKTCRFMHVSGSADYSMWFGSSEQKVIERFNAARKAALDGPVVMFFDEVDAIAAHRGSNVSSDAPDRILNTLLSQMDGVEPLKNIIVLLATNRPEALDRGFVRDGRIEELLEIPAPNRRAALQVLSKYLSKLPEAALRTDVTSLVTPLLAQLFAPNGKYANVGEVRLSDNRRVPISGRDMISGAMLESVVKAAGEQAAVRQANGGTPGMGVEDLTNALEKKLTKAVSLLDRGNVKSYLRTIPQDSQVVAVEVTMPLTTNYLR